MSESGNNTEQEENSGKSPIGFIVLIFALLALVLGIGLYKNSQNASKSETVEVASADAPAPTEEAVSDEVMTDEELAANVSVALDIAKAAKPRILGNPDAPVKISEHSSFTCPHCATFHAENFKRIKEEFIDTGKAYLVFDDFPRNKYDIEIGAVARCVPEDSYFKFVQLLFETQRDWLDEDYITYVTQNAKLTGASNEMIQACLNSDELKEALAKNRQAAMETFDITGTPTLVINDKEVINALSPFDVIQIMIEKVLAEKGDAQ